jgi:hypothetical protein
MKNIPKTIIVNAKCSDQCNLVFKNETGNIIADYNGYVPSWLGNDQFCSELCYGDYVELEIDLKSGKIIDWKAPTKKQIEVTLAS